MIMKQANIAKHKIFPWNHHHHNDQKIGVKSCVRLDTAGGGAHVDVEKTKEKTEAPDATV